MTRYLLEHHYIEVNSRPNGFADETIRLHVVQAGLVDGPLVILLHGFPEFWYGWKAQIGPLTEAGYRVWVPDQRGYNLSDKPGGIGAYSVDELAADVIGLIDAAGCQKAVLVGHDWGAAVAWWTAATYPGRIERLIVLNVPHPSVMKRFASRDIGQMLRSWYIGFFQLPWLPEFAARFGNWTALVRTMRGSSRRETFTDADIAQYRAAWSQPGAFGATLNWYRAAVRRSPGRVATLRIVVPTLIIWGVRDRFLKREMASLSLEKCDNGQLVFIDQATHWVQHEEAERVNTLILAELGSRLVD